MVGKTLSTAQRLQKAGERRTEQVKSICIIYYLKKNGIFNADVKVR